MILLFSKYFYMIKGVFYIQDVKSKVNSSLKYASPDSFILVSGFSFEKFPGQKKEAGLSVYSNLSLLNRIAISSEQKKPLLRINSPFSESSSSGMSLRSILLTFNSYGCPRVCFISDRNVCLKFSSRSTPKSRL